MDESTIIEVLKGWNPWERKIDSGIRRNLYIEGVYPYIDRREVIVLKGIRRSGKSTIMKQLMEELVSHGVGVKQLLYLNLEDYNFANDLRPELFEETFKAYRKYSGSEKKVYFFIDEIQKVDGWEKWIRTKYDLKENIKFIISGSSASLLSRELSTLLTGRNLSFKIMPLSYGEFLEFTKNGKLDDYLEFGGFPEVVLEPERDKKVFLLRQYFDDIIHKDIIDRYNIRNAKQLKEIARYIVSSSGAKISYNKLSKVFGLSKDTISMYIGYMIDAYLLFEVTYFSYSAKIRHDVTRLPKLYVLDGGLINVVSVQYRKSRGQMFENAVLVKLAGNFDEISYWSEIKSEVDFVAGENAINVTATDAIPEREWKGLEDFGKKHKNLEPVLVTESITRDKMISLEDFLKKSL